MQAKVTFADVIQQEQGQYVILLLYKEAAQVMGIWTGFH